MIRNLAFAHRSQHVQHGRFNTEDEVRTTSPTRTWFTNARVWCKLFTALIIMAGHRLCARALPLAAHDGLCSRELALPMRAPFVR